MQTLSTNSLESILVFSCISHTTCSVSRSVLVGQCVWDEKGISQMNFIVYYLAHVIASSKNKKQKFAMRSWKNADTYFRTETSVPWLGTCGDTTAWLSHFSSLVRNLLSCAFQRSKTLTKRKTVNVRLTVSGATKSTRGSSSWPQVRSCSWTNRHLNEQLMTLMESFPNLWATHKSQIIILFTKVHYY